MVDLWSTIRRRDSVRSSAMSRLEDRIAIVSGAASGLGRAIALGYAGEGAHVIVVDQNEAGGQATAAEIAALGRRALALASDVASVTDCQAAVERVVADFGRVDVLVNCAGITTNA